MLWVQELLQGKGPKTPLFCIDSRWDLHTNTSAVRRSGRNWYRSLARPNRYRRILMRQLKRIVDRHAALRLDMTNRRTLENSHCCRRWHKLWKKTWIYSSGRRGGGGTPACSTRKGQLRTDSAQNYLRKDMVLVHARPFMNRHLGVLFAWIDSLAQPRLSLILRPTWRFGFFGKWKRRSHSKDYPPKCHFILQETILKAWSPREQVFLERANLYECSNEPAHKG